LSIFVIIRLHCITWQSSVIKITIIGDWLVRENQRVIDAVDDEA